MNWKNKQEVLEEVKKDGSKLILASEELKNDFDVVMTAVKNFSWSIEDAGEKARDNKDIIKEVLKKNSTYIEYASDRLRDDDEIMGIALEKNHWNLRFASDRIKDNKDLVISLIKKCSGVVKYASPRLQNDIDIIKECIKEYGTSVFEYTNDEIRDNREIMLEAIKVTGFNIQYASDRLRNDEELLKTAFNTCSWAFEYAGDKIKEKYNSADDFYNKKIKDDSWNDKVNNGKDNQ